MFEEKISVWLSEGFNFPQIRKKLIMLFWDKVGEDKYSYTPEAIFNKIYLMTELAMVKIKIKSVYRPLDERRLKFSKARGRRFELKKQCFACGLKSQHRHHLIPLKNNGISGKKYLVSLCLDCHKKIHPWM